MEIDRLNEARNKGSSVAAAFFTIVFTFGWLYYVVQRADLINQVGLLVGVYAILGAFYLQFSPRINHRLSLKKACADSITINMYGIGVLSILNSSKFQEVQGVTLEILDPFSLAVANSLVVGLVTGWLVHVYMLKNAIPIESNEREYDT